MTTIQSLTAALPMNVRCQQQHQLRVRRIHRQRRSRGSHRTNFTALLLLLQLAEFVVMIRIGTFILFTSELVVLLPHSGGSVTSTVLVVVAFTSSSPTTTGSGSSSRESAIASLSLSRCPVRRNTKQLGKNNQYYNSIRYRTTTTTTTTTTQLPLLPSSSSSSFLSLERHHSHKLDSLRSIIKIKKPVSFSTQSLPSFLPLSATNGNSNINFDDDDNNKNNTKGEISTFNNIVPINITTDISMIPNNIIDEIIMKWDSFINIFKEKFDWIVLPDYVVSIVSWISRVWKTVVWHTVTFTTGAIIGVVALVIPLHSQLASLSQPVTLFETILSDLEQAYVEPVDTNKLFETGVAAMLRSLDPYTEFEGIQEAVDMTESIEGKYGGVGLVISGAPTTTISSSSTAPPPPIPSSERESDTNSNSNTIVNPSDGKSTSSSPGITRNDNIIIDGTDSINMNQQEQKKKNVLSDNTIDNVGVRVVSAFEGYAFDYGMRVGDKILAIDNVPLTTNDGNTMNVEQVRNRLRGEPGTTVTIDFQRDGVDGMQTITMPRAVVKIRDVKLATLLGNPEDGVGYIQLSGFASDAGREMRNAILYLQRSAEDASHGERSLQGLVLDLRGNPGGLLTSAVDVASLLVPKGSDIVSAKGRGFPGIIYRSRIDPILDTSITKLAVLINGNTASAAEIVSGAVQDLDVGIIVGTDRTFGKGLVQNVEELPYNTALKFTVAKYYTPSGRCIQGINYKEGDKNENDGKYIASKIEEQDRGTFYTRYGRTVRDGGGVEADYKVPSTKASALELVLFRSGLFSDFAAEWSKNHELTNNFAVDEDTYKSFQAFVNTKQKSGAVQLEALYGKPLEDLKKALKASGYSGSEKSLEQLQARIVRDIQNDFDKYRSDLKEDISQSILARYVPESMLIERGVKRDPQVAAAVELVSQRSTFDKLLAKGSSGERTGYGAHPPITSFNVAAAEATTASPSQLTPSTTCDEISGIRSAIKW